MINLHKKERRLVCVGRVSSSQYPIKNGFSFTKKFTVLKRKSDLNYDDLLTDIQEYLPINFLDVEDGIYYLSATNISKDWETGIIDDWDVELVPYEEQSE